MLAQATGEHSLLAPEKPILRLQKVSRQPVQAGDGEGEQEGEGGDRGRGKGRVLKGTGVQEPGKAAESARLA